VREAPGLLVVGGASLDLLHFAGRSERSAGGAGLYTALAARCAGARVTMLAPRPDPMPEDLDTAADRVVWIGPRVPPEELPHFEIVHDGEGRASMRRAEWGAEGRLTPADLPDGELPEWSYCVPFFEPARQIDFLRALRARGRRTAAGTYSGAIARDSQRVREVLGLADVFFCNEEEARTLFGSLDAARTDAGRLLFVTRGKRGARVVQGGHATDVPGVVVRELDPTGAGDTFCGTVLARLGLGEHPVRAAEHGVRAAAEMITAVGPAALLSPDPPSREPEDSRVRVDDDRLEGVARLLGAMGDARPFDFVGEDFPAPADPRALDFFFASTLQQFGFWEAGDDGGYARPFVATLGGRPRKGSDYLWAAYRRWLRDAPEGLTPAGQEALDEDELLRRLASDGGERSMPAADLRLREARAYGRDMQALAATPADVVARAAASPRPLRSLLTQLDHVGGYKEDPLRKKSALLAMILRERPERWLPAEGDEDLPPIVDYHVQRSCLRLGFVAVEDEALRRRLEARAAVAMDEERAVRRAAFRAVGELQRRSGRTMAVCDRFLFEMRTRCPEMSEPECARCPADPACAHRKALFQPVRRTAFY
jgi:sugar/nucleoside kinase (ribokinase family)